MNEVQAKVFKQVTDSYQYYPYMGHVHSTWQNQPLFEVWDDRAGAIRLIVFFEQDDSLAELKDLFKKYVQRLRDENNYLYVDEIVVYSAKGDYYKSEAIE